MRSRSDFPDFETALNEINASPLSDLENALKGISRLLVLQSKEYAKIFTYEDIQKRLEPVKQAQAYYHQYLAEKALEKIKQFPDDLRFDPQGHVLIEIELADTDWAEILRDINLELFYEMDQEQSDYEMEAPTSSFDPKKAVEKRLEVKLTKKIRINLDVKGHSQLEERYQKWVSKSDPPTNLGLEFSTFYSRPPDLDQLKKASNKFIESDSRGSVIPLQEEMEMQMGIVQRVLERKFDEARSSLDKNKWACIRLKASKKINESIRSVFQQALLKSYDLGSEAINIAILNSELDASRPELATACKDILFSTCFEEFGDAFDSEYDRYILGKLKKEDFTSTVASELDHFKLDHQSGLATLTLGTENTSHNKQLGFDTLAFFSILTSKFDCVDGNVIISSLDHSILESRTPSIAQVFGEPSHSESVKDVQVKLEGMYNKLQEQTTGYDAPIIYNLLTSLPSKANQLDKINNRQRASAARILKGAHLYNKKILEKNEHKFVFIMNIPVNQHGAGLNYDSSNGAVVEATLMSDYALIFTLLQHSSEFSKSVQDELEKMYWIANRSYSRFLFSSDEERLGDSYFKDSQQGKDLIKKFKNFKEKLLSFNLLPDSSSSSPSLKQLVAQALLKSFSENTHFSLQFGMVIQSLSVFSESISIYGCKSACERYVSVASRVDFLLSLERKDDKELLENEKNFKKTLQKYIKGENTFYELQKDFDIAFNDHSLFSRAIVSMRDLGANAKLKATKSSNSGAITETDTNYGESGFVSYLKSKHCGSLQPHKKDHSKECDRIFKKNIILYRKPKSIEQEPNLDHHDDKPLTMRPGLPVSSSAPSVNRPVAQHTSLSLFFRTLLSGRNRPKGSSSEDTLNHSKTPTPN